MQLFIASLWSRQIQVAVMVRLIAQAANAIGEKIEYQYLL